MEEKQNSAKEKVEKLSNPPKTEEEKAQNRVRVAKAKKEQKNDKKKAKLAQKKKRENAKKQKQLLKQEKVKLKQEKAKQKELKQQEERALKQEKIEMFKAEKLKLKAEKEAQKTQIKQQKLEQKAKAKADKRQKREARRKRRSEKGVGGWIAAVVSLGLTSLVLATLLMVNFYSGLKDFPQAMVSQGYYQCYEEFATYNQNIDTNLSKFFVSNSKAEQQRLLIKVTEDSLLAEENLQRLPLLTSSKHSTTKIINQIGDYAKYLNNKLIDGLNITLEEKDNLYRLYEYNKSIKEGLIKISSELKNGAKIEKIFEQNNVGDKVFLELEDRAVVYPQLIYDGPFSDGLNTKKAKGLSGKEISESQAEKVFKGIFASYKLNQHQVVGEFNGQIKCYNLNAKDEFGNDLYAEISKVGGKLISFNYQRECDSQNELISLSECEKIGLKFLSEQNLDNMKAVWKEDNGEMVTINYAYTQGGVVVYPDLVKLNICKKSGIVFGLEGTNYYLNHTQREIANATLSAEQALNKVSENLQVEQVRLALIPKGNDKEVLTYEISGENNDGYYFVYINATNGKEEQIFMVVDTEQGELLI